MKRMKMMKKVQLAFVELIQCNELVIIIIYNHLNYNFKSF